MFQESVREEAQKWVERLKASVTPQDRIRAASQLRSVAVRTRGAVTTRGSLSQAGTPLVSRRDLEEVLRELSEQPPEVRGEVAFALGEVGGEDMVEPLVRLAKDPEASVRLISADALGRIGGPKAVQALVSIAKSDPDENVRALAVEALGILAIQERKAVAVRTRGAVQTGGPLAVERAGISTDVEALGQALERIGQEDQSSYVRETVRDMLSILRSR